jgi:putative peptidoglycan lipid II flippase
MSIATTFIPEMARAVARRDRDSFVDRTALGVRLVGILTIPAAFGFLALARPIVGALLQHGQFDAAAADTTSRALAGLSLGLIGYSIYLFALRGFYAHQDTRTPFVINLGQNALNIVLAFVLVGPFDVLGLGLAFAISYLAAAIVTLFVLRIKVPSFPALDVIAGLSRVVLAGAAMGLIVWLSVRAFGDNDGGGAVVRLIAGTGIGVITYLGALQLLRSPEIDHLRNLRRRLRESVTDSTDSDSDTNLVGERDESD